MRVPLEGGGRLVVEINADEVEELRASLAGAQAAAAAR
jgi:tRNA threonylcarbamoyladenosine modification (KEOPS) complex  Pcc1 subunit